MTRRRVLILAAIVAALLLAADFHDLFALPSFRRLWPWLGDVCGWLAKPIPMALVTLGASLALPRDSARLPVAVSYTHLDGPTVIHGMQTQLPSVGSLKIIQPNQSRPVGRYQIGLLIHIKAAECLRKHSVLRQAIKIA